MEKNSNRIASNILVQIAGRVLVLILSLISIKLITNYLGVAGTGYYNTIITYFTFFITIADFGLFAVGVREISRAPEKLKRIIGNIFTIRLVSATLATILACLIVFFTHYPPEIKFGVLAAAAFPLFNLSASVFDIYFQYRLEMQKVATAEVISKFVALGAVYLAIIFNLGFYFIVASISLAAFLNYSIKYLYSKKVGIKLSYDKSLVKWIISLSLPLGLVFIVNNFYFKVDTLILFYFKGASEVGIYSVAYKVLETTIFAAAYLAYSLKPLFSTAVNKDKDRASAAVRNGLTFLLLMSLAIVVACLPFSREIIIFLSNNSFVAGAPVVIIVAFAAIFIYFNILMGEVMIAKDLRRYLMFVAIFVLLFNIITNIIFIPRYSFIAAAWTTLASEILLLIFGAGKVSTIIKLRPDFWRFSKLIFSAMVSIFVAFALKNLELYFIFAIIISMLVYFGLTYLLGGIPQDLIKDYLLETKNKWNHVSSQ
ncbi:MAG: flippase [Candidatus Berkelbacteria bacterium]|nr:flippase [Candidatus Berkelbacteria bacterium]